MTGFVYVVRIGARGPIKIGFSESPMDRVASLDAVGQECGAAQAKPPTPSFLGRLWLWRRGP